VSQESRPIPRFEPPLNERLRQERRRRGWTQGEVAERLAGEAVELGEPEVGIDGHMVGCWERGDRRPGRRYMHLLCRLFDISFEEGERAWKRSGDR
jgi:transcriptional regulator with XRE-family HTH domain